MHFKKQTWIIHQACTKFDGNLPPFNLNFVSENLERKFSDKKLIIVDLFHQKTFEKVIFLCDIINFAINLFFLVAIFWFITVGWYVEEIVFSVHHSQVFGYVKAKQTFMVMSGKKQETFFVLFFMGIIIFIWNGPFSLIMVSMQTFSINFVINVMSDS